MQHKKPTRTHRVVREAPKIHIEDDSSHSWAVSYSDFLMVLLSFFILFFSVSKTDKDAIISIVSKIKEKGMTGNGGDPAVAAGSSRGVDTQEIVAGVQKELHGLKYEFNDKLKSVTFILADDIYNLGSVRPSREGEESLRNLLNVLAPYTSEIDIVFVGHTDSKPMLLDKVPGVTDNFDLSALRASYAVRLALSAGFPKERLFTHGAADNTRISKSLSVVLKPRGRGQI